ncbi:MAG: hypothetical protein ACLRI7_10085 [Ruthenibacterium lactatiformans]
MNNGEGKILYCLGVFIVIAGILGAIVLAVSLGDVGYERNWGLTIGIILVGSLWSIMLKSFYIFGYLLDEVCFIKKNWIIKFY